MNLFERMRLENKLRTSSEQELREVFAVLAASIPDKMLDVAGMLVAAEQQRRGRIPTS